jgi:hypothetical protein
LVRRFLTAVTLIAVSATAGMTGAPARAEELSKQELAKISQNPIGNLISVPIENDFNFNVGPNRGLLNVVKFEPVIPISVNQDWNVITRTIIPVISQPALFAGDNRINGAGETQFSAFLSPANPVNGLVWGVGAITQLPTTSDSAAPSAKTFVSSAKACRRRTASAPSVRSTPAASPSARRWSAGRSRRMARPITSWRRSSPRPARGLGPPAHPASA